MLNLPSGIVKTDIKNNVYVVVESGLVWNIMPYRILDAYRKFEKS
jgi:hypothetical protein